MTAFIANPRRGGLRLVVRLVVVLGLWFGLFGLVAAVGTYAYFARGMPAVVPFEQLGFAPVTTFYADDGQVIAEFYEHRRLAVAYGQLPPRLIQAFLAAEDENFFAHAGLDIKGILRATWANLRAGEIREGASTITQQVARALLGESKKSLSRKVREAILARRMEDVYTKEQILLLYVNKIFFGHGSYGVQAAAQNYFRKDVDELNLAEMAMLAGLPQSPSRLNPAINPAAAARRQQHVLRQMVSNGFISEAERAAALATALDIHPRLDPFGDMVPYFSAYVRDRLRATYGGGPGDWRERGLQVYTTVSVPLQRAGEEALLRAVRQLDRRHGYRGPLLHLAEARWTELLARTAAELGADPPAEGSRWPAVVTAVSAESVEARITPQWWGHIDHEGFKWAGPYVVRKGLESFDTRLHDARKALQPGDVVLVRVREKATASPLPLALEQEPAVEGAVFAADPLSRDVKVMVGGYDFDRSEVNRVFSPRQTGSTIKPIFYALAYRLGLAPSTRFSNAPFREDEYTLGDESLTDGSAPDSYTLWEGLARSLNPISARVMSFVRRQASVAAINEWATRLGLTEPLKGFTAEMFGVDQTLWGLTQAFGTFLNGGEQTRFHAVRRIVDRDGRVLERHPVLHDPLNTPVDVFEALHEALGATPVQAIPQDVAYLITANLREVVRSGTAAKKAKRFPWPIAGKTGTLPFDVWFSGFADPVVATVWLGAEHRERSLGSHKRRSGVYGADTALPVWLQFMRAALRGAAKVELPRRQPDGVEWLDIDPATGLLARPEAKVKLAIPHVAGTGPKEMTPAPEEPLPDGDPGVIDSEF